MARLKSLVRHSNRQSTARETIRRAVSGVLVAGCAVVWTLPASTRAVEPAGNTPAPAGAASTPVAYADIVKLIDQLSADDFFVREKAQTDLAALGVEAFDALSEAVEQRREVETLERLRYLLRVIKFDWVATGDPDEVAREMQNYEGADDNQRLALITRMSASPDVKWIAPLCRIVRYERSPSLSKQAAVRLIGQKLPKDDDWKVRAAALRGGVGESHRAAAAWVRAHVAAREDASTGATEFGKLVDDETKLFQQAPHRSGPDVLIGLWRRQAELLKTTGRAREAVVAMMNIVALENGTETLTEVLHWLVDNKAWPEVDQVAERFAAKIQDDVLLMYELANARRVEGRKEDEAKLVAAAQGKSQGNQERAIRTAIALNQRGMSDYSDAEYQLAIKMGNPGEELTLAAQSLLGESWHDRERDLEAGKLVQKAADELEAALRKGDVPAGTGGRGTNAMRARAHYFLALHYGRAGDREKQKVELLEGLGEDQYDTEILIALFQVPDLETSVRDRVRSLIRDSADLYRQQIKSNGDDDTPYNQLAWLIANTEGDFQEALRASQRSLELKPDSAGHMDTLARCYYALGDFENAVKQQQQAIELDPHSHQMRRQLAVFEAALAKKKS